MTLGTTKVTESFAELTNHELKPTSLLRLFNILLDVDRQTRFFNIIKSYKVNDDILTNISFFDTYETEGESQVWWENISYEIYGTPYLWWVIPLFNDVVNPFEEIEAGDNLKVLKPEYLYTVFKDMEDIGVL
jgi:hypothetical protein